jgi:hypothetical protein
LAAQTGQVAVGAGEGVERRDREVGVADRARVDAGGQPRQRGPLEQRARGVEHRDVQVGAEPVEARPSSAAVIAPKA